MASYTDVSLRNKVIYQVFPRQYSNTSNLEGIRKDLDRIKNLGVDIIHLLPIHKIGLIARKGNLGSPYSVFDYYSIDKNLGTLDDLENLVKSAHEKGIKIIMDMVFNHSSCDSILRDKNLDFYLKELPRKVDDWSDVLDLDYSNPKVVDYFIDVLKYWIRIVDGFRFDVAALVPLSFYEKARKEVSKIKHDNIFLAESVDKYFIKNLRDRGFTGLSDSELYTVFDCCYDYDIREFFEGIFDSKTNLKKWLLEVNNQESIYPANYVKLRSFENHDMVRLRSRVKTELEFLNYLSLQFFLRGISLIYAGEEFSNKKTPSLFELDLIDYDYKNDISSFISKLSLIHKKDFFSLGVFQVEKYSSCPVLSYSYASQKIVGIFNIYQEDIIDINIPDGKYFNLLEEDTFRIVENKITSYKKPIIIII
ncbi:MAG: hypothetical protein LBV58_01960 [Acholeplasmatales bacterium]|jgi:glycosidase|nr:hypothetical protein [Acholeplasmatales bacterium]